MAEKTITWYNKLKEDINGQIKQNGRREITGAKLNGVLNKMVDALGKNMTFGGVVSPATVIDNTDDNPVFYLALVAGNYPYCGNIVVGQGQIAILFRDANNIWYQASWNASDENFTEEEKTKLQGLPTEEQLRKALDAKANAPESKPGSNNLASFDKDGNLKDSGLLIPVPGIEEKNHILALGENGLEWVPKPADGDDAYGVYVNEYKDGHGGSTDGMLTRPQWLASLKGENGDNAPQPFKGWFTPSTIPLTGQEGDYCYVDDGGTTKVWRWNPNAEPPAFEETTDTPDTDHTQTFASNESVNQVAIDGSKLVNPVNTADPNKPVLAKAEDVMQLKAKLDGVTASETKAIIGEQISGYINGNGVPTAVSSGSTTTYVVVALNNAKSVRLLGSTNSGIGTNYASYAFWNSATYVDSSTVVEAHNWDIREGSTNYAKEYTLAVPNGATHIAVTLSTPTNQPNFYCYLQSGENVVDLIPKIDNTHLSNPAEGSVASADDVKNSLYEITSSIQAEENIDIDSVSDVARIINGNGVWQAPTVPSGASGSSAINYRHALVPVTAGMNLEIKAKEDVFCRYAFFVTKYSTDVPDLGVTADLVEGTTRYGINSGSTVKIIVPDTCHYLYLQSSTIIGTTKTDCLPEFVKNILSTRETLVYKDEIVNDLTSDYPDHPLAAKQGKVLDGKVSAIDSEIFTIENIDLTQFIQKGKFINNSGKWQGDDASGFIQVPVKAGWLFYFLGNETEKSRFAYLSEYVNKAGSDGADAPVISLEEGVYTYNIVSNEISPVYKVPENCKYLYIRTLSRTSGNISPQGLTIKHLKTSLVENVPVIVERNPDSEYNQLIQAGGWWHQDTTPKPSTLLWYTDIHGDKVNQQNIIDWKKWYSSHVDDILDTGDFMKLHFFEDSSWLDGSILRCVGNHDSWAKEAQFNASTHDEDYPGLTFADMTEGTFGSTYSLIKQKFVYDKYYLENIASWGVTQPANAETNGYCYYYKDYSSFRLICLDSFHYYRCDDNGEQDTWFRSILADSITNSKPVVVAMHMNPATGTVDGSLKCLFDYVDCAYNYAQYSDDGYSGDVTRLQCYNAVKDFILNGGNFVCWLVGHTHTNRICLIDKGTAHEQLLIVQATATCTVSSITQRRMGVRVSGTKTDDCFCMITVDSARKLVKMVRIGSDINDEMGTSRTITYRYSNITESDGTVLPKGLIRCE